MNEMIEVLAPFDGVPVGCVSAAMRPAVYVLFAHAFLLAVVATLPNRAPHIPGERLRFLNAEFCC
jgi:hypothetical protein